MNRLSDERKTEGHEDYLESDVNLAEGRQSGISPPPESSYKVYFEASKGILWF